MLESPVLEGQLVHLEPLTVGHVAGLLEAATTERETYRYTLVPGDKASMQRYVETALAEHDAGTSVPYTTRAVASGKIVGATRFMRIQYWDWAPGSPHQRGATLPDAVEIGSTFLAEVAQRTGINTEAKLLMLTHAFETWQVHRVRLTTDARNQRSRAAIERLGARLDGVLRSDHAAYDGAVRDSAYYSLLDSEWPPAKEALIARLQLGKSPATETHPA